MKPFKEDLPLISLGLPLLLTLVFLATRFYLLGTSLEGLYAGEELRQGWIARQFLYGLQAPLPFYFSIGGGGGNFLLGLCAAPFFLLLGPSLFALKLAPLFLLVATMLALFQFLKTFFDFKTALIGMMIFLFMPPGPTAISLIAVQSPAQAAFISVIILFYFYAYLFLGQKKRDLLLFGFFSGFGIWVSASQGVVLLACLLTALCLDRRFFRVKSTCLLIMAFIGGLLPFSFYGARHGWNAIGPWRSGFDAFSLNGNAWSWEGIQSGLSQTVFEGMRSVLGFQPLGPFSSETLCGLYILIGAVLMAPLLWQSLCYQVSAFRFRTLQAGFSGETWKRTLGLFFIFYAAILFILYLGSHFQASPLLSGISFSYYSAPLFLFVTMLVAVCARRESKKRWLVILLLILGALGQRALFNRNSVAKMMDLPGYREDLSDWIWQHGAQAIPESMKAFYDWRSQYPHGQRDLFYRRLAHQKKFYKEAARDMIYEVIQGAPVHYQEIMYREWGGAINLATVEDQSTLKAVKTRIPEDYRVAFYEGLGRGLKGAEANEWREVARLLSSVKGEAREAFYFSAGNQFYEHYLEGGFFISQEKEFKNAANHFNQIEPSDSQNNQWFWRGVGTGVRIYWKNEKSSFVTLKQLMSLVPAHLREAIAWGVGWKLRQSQLSKNELYGRVQLNQLPVSLQSYAIKGFEACENACLR